MEVRVLQGTAPGRRRTPLEDAYDQFRLERQVNRGEPRRYSRGFAAAWADAPSPVIAVRSQSPLLGEVRGPVTKPVGLCRIADCQSPRRGPLHYDLHKALYQLALRSGNSSSSPCCVAQTAAWALELRFSLLRMFEM